jgi:hypothetical protein
MFKETAEQWVEDLKALGKFRDLDEAALRRLVEDYAGRIEAFYHEAVHRQLEPIGKVSEYERMILFDTQYLHKYLNQTIPGYPAFRYDVLQEARKAILGDS